MSASIADVAVVGAGLVGTSIALGLARGGASVQMFDAGEDRLHASAGNFGLVWVQGKGGTSPDYARLTRRSADAWQNFAYSLTKDYPLHYQRTGGIKIALSDDELESMRRTLTRYHNNPAFVANDARIIGRNELRNRLPTVGPDAVGGTYCPHDGHADSLATLQALHVALACCTNVRVVRDRVVSFDTGAPTARFDIHSARARYRADRVVLAAGLGNQALAGSLGLNACLRPERGQILVTERTAPFLDVACHNVRQLVNGTVLLGHSHEDVGVDVGVTQDVTRTILQRAVRSFPILAGARLQRTWGALRVLSPDGLPVYECSERYPGASLITCHSGVTLAAVHATEVAAALLADRLHERYAAFSPARFNRAT